MPAYMSTNTLHTNQLLRRLKCFSCPEPELLRHSFFALFLELLIHLLSFEASPALASVTWAAGGISDLQMLTLKETNVNLPSHWCA